MTQPLPRRDADRTRMRILDAAERVFERDGWRNATLAAIGTEAGVSRGTPGYFFRSKAGLRTAMGARLVQAARDAASMELAGAPADRIICILSGQLGVVAARPALSRLVAEHWLGGNEPPGDGGTGLEALERDLIRQIGELIDMVPGRAPEPEAGGAAAALLALAWSAGLPGITGGSVVTGGAALTDRSALLASLVHRLFVDMALRPCRAADGAPPSNSLSPSKPRVWRLPGVG